MLVGLGQSVCLPVGRKCGECDLGLEGLCKAAERKKIIEGRRHVKKEEVIEEDGTVLKLEQVKSEVVIKEEVVNESPDLGDAAHSPRLDAASGETAVSGRKRRVKRQAT